MDDRSFDSLVRSLASGANRRQILKGFLGLGGAAVAGVGLSGVEAARRPTPTPKPVICPGRQTWNGSACACPGDAPIECGPDCCTEGLVPAHTPEYSECCDNECCFGHCYGEELCCPYPREFCAITGECCPEGWTCCPDYGCISPERCCTTADCPFRECFQAFCSAEHYCAYGDDCLSGAGCCDAPACFRSDCLGDGTCGDLFFDCRIWEEEDCCGANVCLQSNGQCCTPKTCADLTAPYTCSVDDGCGNRVLCPDACPEGWACDSSNGLCYNQTTNCIAAYCDDTHLGVCAGGTGFCNVTASGSLACVSAYTDLGNCGVCTSSAGCESGWVCLEDGNGCVFDCNPGDGSGCGQLVVGP